MKITSSLRYIPTVVFALSLAAKPGIAAQCIFSPVTTWYNTVFAGPYRLEFDLHDPAGPHPYRWLADAGLRIRHPSGTTCLVSPDVAIVALPIYITAGRYLYINTYSGSEETLFVVDAHNCATIWRSPQWAGPGLRHTKTGFHMPGVGQMTIKHDCLPGKIAGRK